MTKKRAYASIIAVILIVVIITVGLSLVAITNNDYNLADRKADWTERYYYSEAQLMSGIARLNLELRKKAVLPGAEELAPLVENIADKLDGNLELKKCGEGRIELLFSEPNQESRMLLWAVLVRAEDGNLRIASLHQEQEQLEYDSFY